jgi:DNA polymerase-3 subunit alpha
MIDYNDEKTWALFREGLTKGVFQLESNLGRTWSKKVAPENLEELAALVSIIRPGCLKAVDRGKTMSNRFVDRKWLKEEVTYLHDSLEDILKPTYGVLVYQEQAMRIAQKLAGFDLKKADDLRKAIGKKNAELMALIRNDFIAGCKEVGGSRSPLVTHLTKAMRLLTVSTPTGLLGTKLTTRKSSFCLTCTMRMKSKIPIKKSTS